MRTVLATMLFAAAPLVQAASPFQSELLHMDLPKPPASAQAERPLAKQDPTKATTLLVTRSRAEVLAELRAARASGELDHAAAESGLPPGTGRLHPATRLAGPGGDRSGLGQR